MTGNCCFDLSIVDEREVDLGFCFEENRIALKRSVGDLYQKNRDDRHDQEDQYRDDNHSQPEEDPIKITFGKTSINGLQCREIAKTSIIGRLRIDDERIFDLDIFLDEEERKIQNDTNDEQDREVGIEICHWFDIVLARPLHNLVTFPGYDENDEDRHELRDIAHRKSEVNREQVQRQTDAFEAFRVTEREEHIDRIGTSVEIKNV